MAGSVNKVILIGNLGHDPSIRSTEAGVAVCSLSIATNEVRKSRGGRREESVEWHRVTVFGEQAENCGKYLAKGRTVYIEGRLQTRKWVGKDKAEKSGTEVVADRVVFLGGGGTMSASAPASRPPADPRPADQGEPGRATPRSTDGADGIGEDDDDIPF